jgi:hypothetical protein
MMLVPKGGLEPPRVTPHAPQTCASTSSATSARSGRIIKSASCESAKKFYLLGCGDAVMTVENGVGVGTAVVGAAVGVAVETGASGTPDCKTDVVPVSQGSESISAISMKAAAAPIVIFASNVCVPRGPKAVLETELVNNAPASALPGCNKTTRIRMTHARINNPYKT